MNDVDLCWGDGGVEGGAQRGSSGGGGGNFIPKGFGKDSGGP